MQNFGRPEAHDPWEGKKMPVARRLSHGLFREAEENLFGMQAECTGLDA